MHIFYGNFKNRQDTVKKGKGKCKKIQGAGQKYNCMLIQQRITSHFRKKTNSDGKELEIMNFD